MLLDIGGNNLFMSYLILEPTHYNSQKKYNIVREIYTFVMRLCTGHCILSRKIRVTKSQTLCKSIMVTFQCNNIALKQIAGCSAMKFATFFKHIMFLNNMGAQGIRHVINIIGYVRDIPDRAHFTSCQLCIVTSTRLSFGLHILQTKRMYK